MKPTTKRALMTHITKKREEDKEYHGDDMGRRYGMPEDKFRDRRGREHYDNGRYAPMDRYDGYPETEPDMRFTRPPERGSEIRRGKIGMEYEPDEGDYIPEGRRRRDSRGRYTSVRNEYEPYEDDDQPRNLRIMPPYKRVTRPMGKIGFSVDGEMERLPYDEDDQYDKQRKNMSRSGSKKVQPMTKQMAMEWAEGLENVDGTKGPHWTMEQVKTVMAQKGIECEPVDFFLALNLTYSDLSKEFKKYGINNLDAYIDFAKAFWLDDPDVQDKLPKYYEFVVK